MTSSPERADARLHARLFARVTRELATEKNLLTSCESVVRLGKTLVGCDMTTLWLVRPQGGAHLLASTDPVLAEVQQDLIAKVRQGPEHDCLTTRARVRFGNLGSIHGRWPAYSEAMLRSAEPLLSGLALPLGLEGGAQGAIAFASKEPEFFDAVVDEFAEILSDQLSVVFELAIQRDRADNLKVALDSNRRIGMALGVVMNAQRCTEAQAFDLLRETSQRSHLKLSAVAEDVILTGSTTPR